MRANAAQGQQKIKVKKRRRAAFVILLSLTAFSSVLVALSLASFLPALTIDSVRVEGAKHESPEAVAAFAETFSAHNLLGFFSGRNVVLYRTHALQSALLTAFPRFESVNVSRAGLTDATIDVTERAPNALWCPGTGASALRDTHGCLVSDENGFLFADVDHSLASTTDTVIFNTPGEDKKIGDYAVPTPRYRDIGFFLRELSTLDLPASGIAISDNSFAVAIKRGGRLILDPSQDLTQALKLIESLKNNKDLGFGTDSFMRNLDYFDLRYSGKAVYRMKGKSAATSTSSAL